jgi:hypothetical protein
VVYQNMVADNQDYLIGRKFLNMSYRFIELFLLVSYNLS